jgi:hypothetical protein
LQEFSGNVEMEDQIRLIQQCKERSRGNLAAELSELLGVNLDAAYRRMRGDTSLTLDEIKKICLKYSISFDSIINYSGSVVPFQFNAMFNEEFSILHYLRDIADQLAVMAQIENSKIVLTAMDLPYFRIFGFKALSKFKLFFWQRSVLNLEKFKFKKFDVDDEMDEYLEVVDRIYRDYHKVESVEIWAPESLDSTIKQVIYYIESGLFTNKKTIDAIYQDLEFLLNKLENEAALGKKILQSPKEIVTSKFDMYQSDIFLSNNSIQANIDDRVYSYVSFNSFNSLMSFSPSFSLECKMWIEQIRLKSVLLSEVSEKLRYQYFLKLRNRLEELKRLF